MGTDDLVIIVGGVSLMWVATSWAFIVLEEFNKTNMIKYICLKCWSFWFILVWTCGDIFTAAFGALVAYILDLYVLKE